MDSEINIHKTPVKELCDKFNIKLFREKSESEYTGRSKYTWYFYGFSNLASNKKNKLSTTHAYTNNIKILFTNKHHIIYIKDYGLYENDGKRKKNMSRAEAEFYIDVAKSDKELSFYGLRMIFNEPTFRLYLTHSNLRNLIYREGGYIKMEDAKELYNNITQEQLESLKIINRKKPSLTINEKLETFAHNYRKKSIGDIERLHKNLLKKRDEERRLRREKAMNSN